MQDFLVLWPLHLLLWWLYVLCEFFSSHDDNHKAVTLYYTCTFIYFGFMTFFLHFYVPFRRWVWQKNAYGPNWLHVLQYISYTFHFSWFSNFCLWSRQLLCYTLICLCHRQRCHDAMLVIYDLYLPYFHYVLIYTLILSTCQFACWLKVNDSVRIFNPMLLGNVCCSMIGYIHKMVMTNYLFSSQFQLFGCSRKWQWVVCFLDDNYFNSRPFWINVLIWLHSNVPSLHVTSEVNLTSSFWNIIITENDRLWLNQLLYGDLGTLTLQSFPFSGAIANFMVHSPSLMLLSAEAVCVCYMCTLQCKIWACPLPTN